MKYHEYTPTNITTTTTTQVATGRGVLHTIVVGTTAAGAITIMDGTASSTTVIGTLKSSIAEGTYTYDCVFSKGLRVTTAASSDITVNWAQD